jgi:selenocysteine-specific elongation factor
VEPVDPPRLTHRAGIQTQTAECLVIGELTTTKLIVVLNKADLLPPDSHDAALAKLQKRLTATFAATRFAGCTQVVVSARPGGGDSMAAGGVLQPRVASPTSRAM